MKFEEKIVELLSQPQSDPLDAASIARKLRVPKGQREQIPLLLERLEKAGRIARIRRDRYTAPEVADLIPGRILINHSGGGILQPEDPRVPRVVIESEATGVAMHHDRVLVRRETAAPAQKRGEEPAVHGKVIRVLERARTQIVGTLHRSRQFLYVAPDDPRIPHDIYVPEPSDLKRRPAIGDKVVVELVEWVSRHTNPEGTVIETLGRPSERGVDIESILHQYNLPRAFADQIVREASAFGNSVQANELKGRRDCRSDLVITIDPDDAKDFDDAICVKPAGNGQWRLWVHIADVSHYVRIDSALDREARLRGNSTYLVDRVIPMLPEQLSNELCSLKPGVDRLTKCVEFLLSKEGTILRADFYSAVIHSKRRFTYQEALGILEGSPSGPIEKMLVDAHHLAQKLRKARFKNGALNLDFPEYKLRLDEHGAFLRADKMENDHSHQLIEEFMLLANEAVAKSLRERKRAAVYRIHEQPDPQKLDELREQLAIYGVSCGNLSKKGEAQRVLDKLHSHPAGRALTILFLRSLKRARYAVEPLGHYGLAKQDYTHFTSPIRRYADLAVHRALFTQERLSREALAQAADHISFTERNSADAEQDSKTIKLMAYFDLQLTESAPRTYSAVVTEIRNFGFFVELEELGLSGMVRVSTLDDDFYLFDGRSGRLRGRRHGRVISLGDTLQVRPFKVDRVKRHIDFTLAPDPKAKAHSKHSRRPNSPTPAAGGAKNKKPDWRGFKQRSQQRARGSRGSGRRNPGQAKRS